MNVITYGTYDMLHEGHIRLLKRAKALGDYLIVGVTSDAFDKARGKINVKQSTMERVMSVRALGLADKIIIEEYEGQKIDDIRRYDVDIFTVGSDWVGKFDYLREYCQVVYLPRTEGISSSEIRAAERSLRIGFVGELDFMRKFYHEAQMVNGMHIVGLCSEDVGLRSFFTGKTGLITDDYESMLPLVDAVFIVSHPSKHVQQIKLALESGKHVLCESPVAINVAEYEQLTEIAAKKNLIFMESIKTAYATAYYRLMLLVKSGKIGKVVSIDTTCTSIRPVDTRPGSYSWNSICAWGPSAMLPIFQILGVGYNNKQIVSRIVDKRTSFDDFTRINFTYPDAVASLRVGNGVKSEGEMIISGTNGYIYVPAPWWKTDYFEVRYENPADNRRYFYTLEGEGIRYELVAFLKSVQKGRAQTYIAPQVTRQIVSVIEDFYHGKDLFILRR